MSLLRRQKEASLLILQTLVNNNITPIVLSLRIVSSFTPVLPHLRREFGMRRVN